MEIMAKKRRQSKAEIDILSLFSKFRSSSLKRATHARRLLREKETVLDSDVEEEPELSGGSRRISFLLKKRKKIASRAAFRLGEMKDLIIRRFAKAKKTLSSSRSYVLGCGKRSISRACPSSSECTSPQDFEFEAIRELLESNDPVANVCVLHRIDHQT